MFEIARFIYYYVVISDMPKEQDYPGKRSLEEEIDALLELAEKEIDGGFIYTARERARYAKELVEKLGEKASPEYRKRIEARYGEIMKRTVYGPPEKEVSFSELEEEVRKDYPLEFYNNRRVNAYWSS